MTGRVATFAVALVALAAGAGAPSARAAEPPPLVRPITEQGLTDRQLGTQLFAGNCSTCHGSRGEGVPPSHSKRGGSAINGTGPSLKGVGARAADFYLRTGYMPLGHPYDQPVRQRQRFSEREVRALVNYVASLGSGPGIPHPNPAEGDVATGMELFSEHCAGCHQIVAEGGIVTGAKVPPLDQATPRQVAEAIRIGPYVMPKFSRRAITDKEVSDIVAYIKYAQDPHDVGGWGINHLGPYPEGMIAWGITLFVLIGTCMVIGSRLKRGS